MKSVFPFILLLAVIVLMAITLPDAFPPDVSAR